MLSVDHLLAPQRRLRRARVALALLSAAGVTSASLHQTGCAGLCEEEPMATITLADGTMYRYGLLDKDKVHTIVTDHLVGGTPVDAYLIKT